MRSLSLAALVLVGIAGSGCDLYFSDDDDCALVGAPEAYPNELRDPFTGQCQPFGGGYPCDDRCGPCPLADVAAPAIPDWGQCWGTCSGLDEASCAAAEECRVVYDANSNVDQAPQYRECWAIAPSGPASGTCEGLDAYECSRHNDCIAMYDDTDGGLAFTRCVAEAPQGCFSDEECGPDAHCSTSDGECLPPPGCTGEQACPAVCYGRCVKDQGACDLVDCIDGTHCEEHCTVDPWGNTSCDATCVPDQNGCAAADCGPGFECVETCTAEDPKNPGCGICTIECVPVGTCESLVDEASCTSRSDCGAVYNGQNCTCYQDGTCECEILTFDHCETK